MKSDAVDSWIGHWLKIQKKNKRPLVLKSGSDSTSDKWANPIKVSRRRWNKRKDRYIDSDDTDDEAASNDETTDEADDDGLNGDEHGTHPKGAGKSGKGAATATDVQGTRHNGADKVRKASATAKGNPIIVSRRKRNKGKGRYIERDDSEDEASANNEEGGEDRGTAGNADGPRSDSADKVNDGGTNTNGLPPSPSSMAMNRQSRRDFLRSLSDDQNYQKLLLLLRAAEVCNSILACALSKPFPEGQPVQGNATSMGNVEVR